MRIKALVLALGVALSSPGWALIDESNEKIDDSAQVMEDDQDEHAKFRTRDIRIWESLDHKTREITLENSGASLNVPENFFFLGLKDSTIVLNEVWGIPRIRTYWVSFLSP